MPYNSTRSAFETFRDGGSTLDMSMMIKLTLCVRGFRGKLDEKLRKIGQSTSRMETLAAIMNMQGPKSQSDVAKRLQVEGATVTRMVDILSKEGLVERKPAPNDRRVNLLSITAEGEKAMQEIFVVYDEWRNHCLTDFSSDDMRDMHRLLNMLLGRLDNPEAAAMQIEDLPKVDPIAD